ncbi:prolyl-tRNA editing enzyme YbaK/EbsC (Cys-tRNA(Pro) deacylase) [Fictibacillus halophilus]|uniref:Prolyl-tRNA editing enzyme YbaK/EbsC (Cys-tRNA(Pro) deacylase) n=1 Tax=Fictibacillus halophilus TaxID=1610490 RepID=A0ABV2LM22_9BACL
MEHYHRAINSFIIENHLDANHIVLMESCHSVQDAAKAINGSENDFVKNICLLDTNEQLILAIVKGEDRVSTTRVGKALNIERPRLATEDEILALTGFPAGGVPSFGFKATFLVDPNVTQLPYIYTGGGSPCSLIRIETISMLQANSGQVVRIRK